jgi:hypothetical protein
LARELRRTVDELNRVSKYKPHRKSPLKA